MIIRTKHLMIISKQFIIYYDDHYVVLNQRELFKQSVAHL